MEKDNAKQLSVLESSIKDRSGEYAANLFLKLYNEISERDPNAAAYLLGTTDTVTAFDKFFGPEIKEFEDEIRATAKSVSSGLYYLGFGEYEKTIILDLLEKGIRRKEELILGFREEITPADTFRNHTLNNRFNAYKDILKLFRTFMMGFKYMSPMPSDIKEKYFKCVNEVSCFDVETSLKFGCMAIRNMLRDMVHFIRKPVERLAYIDEKAIVDNFIRYANGVKFLLTKNKPAGSTNYKPDGLLSRIVDPKNGRFIVEAFNNPVFLNYLYEDRLPAYSWSASSGGEMMKALTSGDYKSSYNTEKRLIHRAVYGMLVRGVGDLKCKKIFQR